MFTYYRQGVRRAVPAASKSPIDKYTLGHMAWGAILAAIGVPFWGAAMLSVAFEIVENPLKKHIPFIFPEPILDSIGNQVMDTVGVLAGWSLAKSVGELG